MTKSLPQSNPASAGVAETGLRRVGLILRDLSPKIAGPLLFAGGAFHLSSAALPQMTGRLKALSTWLPLGVIELSHMAGSVVGTLLMFVAFGVFRRLQGARMMAIILCAAAALFTVLHGASYLEAGYLASLCCLLAFTGQAYWRTQKTDDCLSTSCGIARHPHRQWSGVFFTSRFGDRRQGGESLTSAWRPYRACHHAGSRR